MAFFPGALAGLALLTLTGCASIHLEQVGKGEAPTVLGPPVRTNTTPLQPALACMAQELDAYRSTPLVIAVGDIRDYTGKYNINEGNAITQGGALMVYSALGELGDRIRIADRYNLEPAQMELTFLNQRVLGDGHDHSLVQGATKKMVPWIPYYGGTVIASDYFITGGITELNYNVQTGGVQFQINELGPKARVFTESIGIDLQIVNTRTLMVVKTISLEKQITGFEVGFNIFRFFGSDLYDLNIGNKSQEPLQLGVRSTLYDGVLRLVSAVSHVPYAPCLARVHDWIPRAPEAKERASVAVPAPLPAPPLPPKAAAAPASAEARNAKTSEAPLQNGLMMKKDGTDRITFNFGATDLTGSDQAEIDRIASKARQHQVQFMLLAPATENWAPSKRMSLLAQRVGAVRNALQLRGILHLSVVWAPDASQTGIVMDGAGYQKLAILAAKA